MICGLIQAGRCWNNTFCNDMVAIGFEQSREASCVFCKVVGEELEMVVIVYVDDILAHAKDQATIGRFAAKIERKFKLKDVGDAEYNIGGHIIKEYEAGEVKLDHYL